MSLAFPSSEDAVFLDATGHSGHNPRLPIWTEE
jgi:hypothetical protein